MTEEQSILMACPKCDGAVVLCAPRLLGPPEKVKCVGHEGDVLHAAKAPCGWWAAFVDEGVGV